MVEPVFGKRAQLECCKLFVSEVAHMVWMHEEIWAHARASKHSADRAFVFWASRAQRLLSHPQFYACLPFRLSSLKCSKISFSKTLFSAKERFCENQCGVDLRVKHIKRQTKLSGFDSHCLFKNPVWTSQCFLRLNTPCDWKRIAEFLDFCIRACRIVLLCFFCT